MAFDNKTFPASSRPTPKKLDPIAEKHKIKRTPYTGESGFTGIPTDYSPELHGLVSGFGRVPGLDVRKPSAESPMTYVTPYNPFASDGTPNEFASLDEKLDFDKAQGYGEMLGAAFLVPALGRFGGRKFAEYMAGRDLTKAKAGAAEAANWMSPKVVRPGRAGKPGVPKPTGPALSGEEAARLAQESGERIVKHPEIVQAAKTLGSDLPLERMTRGGMANLGMRSASNMFEDKVGEARASVMADDNTGVPKQEYPSFAGDPNEVIMGDLQDVQVMQPSPSNAERIKQALAMGDQIPAYQKQPTNFAQRIADWFQPRAAQAGAREDEARYIANERARRGFVSPEAELNVQDLMQQLAAERGLTTTEAAANLPSTQRAATQDFTKSYAPAFQDMRQVEQQFNLPPGSLNPEAMAQMSRNAPSALEQIMEQMYQEAMASRGGQQIGTSGNGMPQSNKLRVPQ